jgi:hypothetical protein
LAIAPYSSIWYSNKNHKTNKMKLVTQNQKSFLKSFLILIFAAFILQSCAAKYAFSTSAVVPAAEGAVKVKKDGNNNYKIQVEVKHLAEPKRLTPARQLYVVWMETEKNGRKNLGQLKTSSGLFSSTLKSSLETVTSFKPVNFIITAEDEGNIQNPGGQVVLETSGS